MKLKMEWTIPNILTTVRLVAIPFLGAFILASKDGNKNSSMFSMIAFVFFAAIWITDAADGYIARRFNMTSDFGKIYDPFVDKLFQFTTAFMMLMIGRIPLWVVIFILAKEIVMILGGAYFLQQRQLVVHSKWYGKASTVLFVMALAALFFLRGDTLYLAHFIFVPPVLMSTYATVRYAITAINNYEELGESEADQKTTQDAQTKE